MPIRRDSKEDAMSTDPRALTSLGLARSRNLLRGLALYVPGCPADAPICTME
jgi:hypothetical protein